MSAPLHPIIVHFPIALMVLIPIITILMFFMLKRGWISNKALIVILLLQVILTGFSYTASATGEQEEERVENVVGEVNLEHHEEAAELFSAMTLIPLIISVFLLIGKTQKYQGKLSLLFAVQVVIVFFGYRVGHSGGELVYQHGAASTYTQNQNIRVLSSKQSAHHGKHEDEHEDDDD